MFKKVRKIALMGGVLAAVSFGGSALAAAGAAPVQPQHVAVTQAANQGAGDGETADGTTQQKGDAETADGTQGAGDTETADGALQGGDAETADGAGGSGESGSEMPGNDGPGGHADEPGNPNAQHEASGEAE